MLSAMYEFLNLLILWGQFYPIYEMGKIKKESIFESIKMVYSIWDGTCVALLEVRWKIRNSFILSGFVKPLFN